MTAVEADTEFVITRETTPEPAETNTPRPAGPVLITRHARDAIATVEKLTWPGGDEHR